jgi:hypothetical protein
MKSLRIGDIVIKKYVPLSMGERENRARDLYEWICLNLPVADLIHGLFILADEDEALLLYNPEETPFDFEDYSLFYISGSYIELIDCGELFDDDIWN